MSANIINTNIEILGKLYAIRCEEDEFKGLQDSADYLNSKMSEIQETGKAITLERIAVMAALNITHEMLTSGKQKLSFLDKINLQITSIQDKIENMLTKPEPIDATYQLEDHTR